MELYEAKVLKQIGEFIGKVLRIDSHTTWRREGRRGQTKEVLAKIGWNLRIEAELLPSFDECPTLDHQLTMNVIIWNSRGVLKPNFQNHVRELARNHSPAIMVIMEI
uniref:Uncharacterized protein n=1 Tax=Quercus lobata TaxID=97700 RepID=A0A7N2LPP0_QUELO